MMPEKTRNDPLVIAHRGASAYLPEHSLAAKALAFGMGADFLEQDVVASRDGEILVLHDVILDDVSDVESRFPGRCREDGHFYCVDFDLAEIRSLRFFERREPGTQSAKYPGRFPKDAGTFSVVTLREELQFIEGLNRASGKRVGIFTEIKDPAWHREQRADVTAATLSILEEFSYLVKGAPLLLACFDDAELRRVRDDVGADLRLVQLSGRHSSLDDTRLRDVATYANAIGPSIHLIYEGRDPTGRPALSDLATRAHAAGLAVYPYTFRADDLPPGIASFRDMLEIFVDDAGVDGVISDFPDRVIEYCRQRMPGRGRR